VKNKWRHQNGAALEIERGCLYGRQSRARASKCLNIELNKIFLAWRQGVAVQRREISWASNDPNVF
jgi:hypothetical protein